MSRMKRIVVIITVVCVFMASCVFYSSYFEYEYAIFSRIDELSILEDYIVDNGDDKNIGDIEYVQRFCYTVRYKGYEYLVCAYEFADSKLSLLYYKNVWNEDFNYWTDWWSRSRSSFDGCEYLTFDKNRVLYFCTHAPLHKATEFEHWLAKSLSIMLPDHNTPIIPNEEELEELQNRVDSILDK